MHQVTLPVMPTIPGTQKTVAKILQSRDEYGMLIKTPSGELITVVGRSHSHLQLLDRTTAEVLLAATNLRSSRSDFADRFESKTRISVLDGALANAKAEAALLRQLNDKDPASAWKRLAITCEVHRIAGVHKKTFGMVDGLISGQINWAMALNTGTNFTRWGKHLKAVVKSKIVFRRGQTSASALAYRKHILRLCASHCPRLLARRLALCMLPNGDWRNTSDIEIFMPDGIAFDAETVRESVAESLRKCLAGRRYRIYPRSRWTRCDEAWDQFLLLEGCHGLARAAWASWAREANAVASDVGTARRSDGPRPSEKALPPHDAPVYGRRHRRYTRRRLAV